jgi:hypothetical protein
MRERERERERERALNRLPGILFLGIVVAVMVALLAGYEIPVGVGAVAAFVLGGIAGFMRALWVTRGAGRALTVGSVSWSSGGTSSAPAERDLAELRAMSELSEIDLGRVIGIQPVMATQ